MIYLFLSISSNKGKIILFKFWHTLYFDSRDSYVISNNYLGRTKEDYLTYKNIFKVRPLFKFFLCDSERYLKFSLDF